ncbi:MAG: TatD family hydrolase [Chloroflexi bacterium]|nr:TatD family hydrolase [Chloroflexota bacterium]
MPFSDSHCHLAGQNTDQLVEVLKQAKTKGVDIMVSMGMSLESSAENIHLAQSYQGVLAAVGIHPWNAVPLTAGVRKYLAELAGHEQVVAIGEIGLDYVRSPQTRDIQKELLIYELCLARERSLPVSIHCREAYQDMMDILHQEVGLKGAIHGFSGDQAELKDWIAMGFYISIGRRGFVTDETPSLQAAVRDIPSYSLLTETDGSGRSGGPADVVSVVEKLAFLRGVTVVQIADITTANLKRFLKL